MALSLLFLKLTVAGKDVAGESTTLNYEGQITCESLEWSVTAKHVTAQAQSGEKTELRPKSLSLSKNFDRATTLLCQHMNARKPFTTAHITMLDPKLFGEKSHSLKLMEITLKDGLIEEVGLQASESGKSIAVKEKLTLSFTKCQIRYYPAYGTKQGRGAAMTFDLVQPSIGD